MGYKRMIQNYYQDVSNLTSLLKTYVDIYRNLIMNTKDLNETYVAKKGEIKDIIERVDDVGEIIDDLIKAIKKAESAYVKYCVIESNVVKSSIQEKEILDKIHRDLYHDMISDDRDDE